MRPRLFQAIKPYLPETPPAVAVVLCCSKGRLLKQLGEHWPHTSFYGIDPDGANIKYCEAALDAIQFCCEEGEIAPPKTEGIAEFVMSVDCLTRTSDPQRALLSLWAALPPWSMKDGRSVNNAMFIEELEHGKDWVNPFKELEDHFIERKPVRLTWEGRVFSVVEGWHPLSREGWTKRQEQDTKN